LHHLAQANQELVADQLATAAGEDGQAIDKARPLLLAAFSREPPNAAAVWEHALEDREAASAGGITDCWVADKMAQGRARQGPVCEESVPNAAGSACEIWRGLEPGLPAAAGAGLDRQPDRDLTLGSVRDYVSCVWKVKMEIPA